MQNMKSDSEWKSSYQEKEAWRCQATLSLSPKRLDWDNCLERGLRSALSIGPRALCTSHLHPHGLCVPAMPSLHKHGQQTQEALPYWTF